MIEDRAVYCRPVGFAEAVRQAGDGWQYHGMKFAERIGDERMKRAFVFANGCNSPAWHDSFVMVCRTKYRERGAA